MSVIRPLLESEFSAWMSRTVPAYAAAKVASGAWAETEALDLAHKETERLLPQGLATPDNYIYVILDGNGLQVGYIWFAIRERAAGQIAYIYDVAIWPEYRRTGHAFRAFQAIDAEVTKLGLAGVALHVFGNNLAAQALYTKLGYITTGINMFKPAGAGD